MSTEFVRSKEQILSAAVPDILRIALLRFPGIRIVPEEELWRALSDANKSSAPWTPALLSSPEVLRKAGANYVLQGRFYEGQGGIQIVGEVVSLSEREERPWRSGSLQSDIFSEPRLLDGVASFAGVIVRALAEGKQLKYQMRKFVAARFCDVSEPTSGSSALYAEDLPKALAERGQLADAVTMTFIESPECTSEQGAAQFAEENGADAVVVGTVNRTREDSVTLEAEIFIPKEGLRRKLPAAKKDDSSYLEQRYALVDRFGQYLSAALKSDGRWDFDILRTERQVPDLLSKVDQLIKLGDLDAAEFLLADALSLDPNSADVHHRVGLAQFRRNRLELAVEEQREALKLRPDFAEAHGALGDALAALGDYEEAEKAYREQLRLQPDSVAAYSALGNLASFQGDTDRAIEQLGNALRIEPANTSARERLADLYHDRAQAHFDKEEYQAAVDDFGLSIESDPSPDPERYFKRAHALSYLEGESQGHGYALAVDDYRKALDIFRGEAGGGFASAVSTYLNLQELYLVLSEYEKSIEIGREFLSLDVLEGLRAPDDELIAPFQIVVALILLNRPHKEALDDLQARIGKSEPVYSGWQFFVFDKFFDAKQASLSAEQIRAIKDVKSLVQSHLNQ